MPAFCAATEAAKAAKARERNISFQQRVFVDIASVMKSTPRLIQEDRFLNASNGKVCLAQRVIVKLSMRIQYEVF